MKILVTCPPMLGMIDEFRENFRTLGIEITCPKVVQTLSEQELIDLVPDHEGWIIGDDPATQAVFEAGKKGNLRAAVKWGIGVDNVDFSAAQRLNIKISNTPGMFGREVADVAMCYILGLARELFSIDREIRNGKWPKPCGISLEGKTAALVGYGDIGRNTARRMLASDMNVIAYDPMYQPFPEVPLVKSAEWPERLDECDFIVFTCALTETNRHILNKDTLDYAKKGVRVVNVARGALIDSKALENALRSGKVHSAALDVLDTEPLPKDSALRNFDNCIFGSHNASNTREAVRATTLRAIKLLAGFLGIQ